ncbi:MAG: hypothetical protein NTZ46_11180, partial [Verrucomicrobia bacterium]|nr:hypothetical protein [Verrucomicrobiota bacterium]
FGHASSRVRELRQLAPLLEGANQIVFNGDSVEMLFLDEREQGAAAVAALAQLCAQAGAKPVFLTGNHDPTLTETHALELAQGAVFVTHGDILFYGSPWSIEVDLLREAHAREMQALGQPTDLQGQLLAMRRASLAIEHLGEKIRALRKPGLLHALARHLWPPLLPLHIVRSWVRTPFLADALVAKHAPRAQFVVVGHTHFGGVWRVGKRVVINTGSFLPLSRRLVIDLETDSLTVREVVLRGGLFRFGREVAKFGFKR